MMLAFVTSLRHPQNSADYARVEELLRETLHSVAQQTVDDYVIIVVGNKQPGFELPPRTEFVRVDYEAPAPPTGPRTARDPFVRDKGTKIGVGLIAARRHAPHHVMIFDADDFIHRDLTRIVTSAPHSPGWVIDRGWMYSRSRNGYRRQDDFNRTCGTSFVIPYEAYEVPQHLDITASQEELIEGYGDVLPNIIGAHRDAVSWHRERGRVLRSFPLRAAVYHVDTGENHSGKAVSGLLRPWNAKFGAAFGIQTSIGGAKAAWRSLGPKAIGESAKEFVTRAVRKAMKLLSRRSGIRS